MDDARGSRTREQSPALTAEHFSTLLHDGRTDLEPGTRVVGDVDLAGVEIARPLLLRGIRFAGHLDLRHCRFRRRVDLTACHFQRLSLAGAHVDGSLILDETVIGADLQPSLDLPSIGRILELLESRPNPRRLRYWRSRAELERRSFPEPRIAADLTNVRVTGSLSLMDAIVYGHLFCNQADIEDDLRIDRTRICGHLNLRRTSLGEIYTDGTSLTRDADSEPKAGPPCRVDGDFDLTCAKIAGDVRLTGIVISGELALRAAEIGGDLLCRSSSRVRSRLRRPVDLSGVQVNGTADFAGSRIFGDLKLDRCQVGGILSCGRQRWPFKLTHGSVSLCNAEVGAGALFMGSQASGSFLCVDSTIHGSVDFEAARLGEHLYFQNSKIGGTFFANSSTGLATNVPCTVAGNAWLLGATITGDLDVRGIHVGGDVVLQNAEIGQNLNAKMRGEVRTEVRGSVYLNGAHVAGSLLFHGAIVGRTLNLDNAVVDEGLVYAYDFSDRPGWEILRGRVGRIQGESARIGRSIVISGVDVGSETLDDDLTLDVPDGIQLTGTEVVGEIQFHGADIVKELLPGKLFDDPTIRISPQERHELTSRGRRQLTRITGPLRLSRAQVLSGLVLDGSAIKGGLDLQDAVVRVGVYCRSTKDPEARIASISGDADFQNLDLVGDMDLTGVEIGNDLVLRNARIRGRLELYRHGVRRPPDQGQEGVPVESGSAFALIGGALRLDAAKIRHVSVSGASFGDRVPVRADRRAETRAAWREGGVPALLLYLLRGGEHEKLAASGERPLRDAVVLERAEIGRLEVAKPFPGLLYLTNLKVESWDERVDVLKCMLDHAPFSKSVYFSIENDLRNRGQDEEADEIHVLMRRRDRRNMTRRSRILWDRLLDASTRYGTTSAKLAWLLTISFVVSVLIFWSPQHVEYVLMPSADQPQPPVRHPSGAWGLIDSIFLALRLHVPIVSLGLDEMVRPSGTLMKTFAMLVTAASWVVWPLLIASLSGFLRQRK